ncbi:MAG: RNHCP domain-containing protein [Myxococcota bacterium]|nr:RNHCP domain-containing protein [Myxococcota bacterium]MEC8424790.1 RNHCP domain-containing protein [Myxococcota bacterium]
MSSADALARLAGVRSRGEIKRLGQDLDRDPSLLAALQAEAARRGLDSGLTGKRLVRALLDRSRSAQIRTNPIHVDEAFTCVHCGMDVRPGGRPVRDHCPHCLRSLHVDRVPGDRASTCGGVLDPTALRLDHGSVVILYRCRSCGHETRTMSHPDDAVPPSLSIADLP